MKALILILSLIVFAFGMNAATARAQGIQPYHFLWMGGGIDGFNKTNPNGVAGYGQRVGDGFYLVTNLIMKPHSSTLSFTPIKHVTEAGPVELFALGEAGLTAGEDVTKSKFGAGGGLSLDVIKRVNPKLENWRLIVAVKVVTPDAGQPAGVKPQFYGGLSYYLK